MNRAAIGLVLVMALCVSCGSISPSPSAPHPSPSSVFVSDAPVPRATVEASAVVAEPSFKPATPSATPPYRLELDSPIRQDPGTILFGSLPGGIDAAELEPYLTWPPEGLTIDADVAFGAFWGEPVRASKVRITLYRVDSGTLHLMWSDTKRVDPDATGYLDELVPFKGPGTYRLEVTRGADLLAWGIAHMGPRCTSNCSGG